GAILVSNVRNLSEIENIELPIFKVEICEILKDIISDIKENYDKRMIKINFESRVNKYYVKANELLSNVFINIIDNAIKYNNSQNIEISIAISDNLINNIEYVKIEFLDNGFGIPDDMKENVFQRAFNKKNTAGMGLGLSLVKKIIEKYNGQIWVEDRIQGDRSKGSNFVILLQAVNEFLD
ncbi:MAG: sensor histidine kinase, partial [Candidatus Hermodarchaeota archaeon]